MRVRGPFAPQAHRLADRRRRGRCRSRVGAFVLAEKGVALFRCSSASSSLPSGAGARKPVRYQREGFSFSRSSRRSRSLGPGPMRSRRRVSTRRARIMAALGLVDHLSLGVDLLLSLLIFGFRLPLHPRRDALVNFFGMALSV